MQFSNSNFISVEQILSDVLRIVDDEAMKKFSKGVYVGLAQQALEQLSLQTFMLKLAKDFPMPTDLILDIPSGCFNIREVFVFNDDCCNVSNSKQVHWKRDYRTQSATRGYISRVTQNTEDPYYDKFNYDTYSTNNTNIGNVFFYGAENGQIFLSPSCATYSKLHIVYNGILTSIGETPIIPLPLRQAIVDWVSTETYRRMMVKDAKLYRALYLDSKAMMNDKFNGSWTNALMWTRTLDSASREDLLNYLSRVND